jgi:transcriptional repressor NrdR
MGICQVNISRGGRTKGRRKGRGGRAKDAEESGKDGAPGLEVVPPCAGRIAFGDDGYLLCDEAAAMKCPYCGFAQDRVVDSRESKDADAIRRRRECEGCNKRFTTYERIDEIPYMVVKKDGRREKFDRQKVLGGLLHACQKRPVPGAALERIVDETEAFVVDSPERERTTSEVGELIMTRLKEIDTVAYIRFASVYRDFKDVREFKVELEELLSGKDARKKKL